MKSHGRTEALRGACFDLRAGEILAATGASGSGESTLLHCLASTARAEARARARAGEWLERFGVRGQEELRPGEMSGGQAQRAALAARVAAGVPRTVLNRALLLETVLPLAPALLLAGVGGMAVGTWYSSPTGDGSLPWTAPLVAPVVYAACLLASATSLPLLDRSVRPGELRYA
nr:hypothetical protein [Streptomyces sp. JHA26]